MSYYVSVNVSDMEDEIDFLNLSWTTFCADSDALISTEEFDFMYEEYTDMYYADDAIPRIELLNRFKSTNLYNELKESFMPISSYIHILQSRPTKGQVDMIRQYTSSCVVIKFMNPKFYGLAMTSYGIDCSDSIELAYYIVDGISPIKSTYNLTLTDSELELRDYCREMVGNYGKVTLAGIMRFINQRKDKQWN